jgi:Skp family chaperone for outer membrane proteins
MTSKEAVLEKAERYNWVGMEGQYGLAPGEMSWRAAVAGATPEILSELDSALDAYERKLQDEGDERAFQRELAEDKQRDLEAEEARRARETPTALMKRQVELLERIADALDAPRRS